MLSILNVLSYECLDEGVGCVECVNYVEDVEF